MPWERGRLARRLARPHAARGRAGQTKDLALEFVRFGSELGMISSPTVREDVTLGRHPAAKMSSL
ncbi:MAG: hypothetical protein L0312_30400, partial [Acidobacteria bacterium]|nr:hypothetical protein [Acidobacteriota bacterium]